MARTEVQRYADRADRELYDLSGSLKQLAKLVNDPEVGELSRRLMGSRGCVRKYMHPDDRIGTEG